MMFWGHPSDSGRVVYPLVMSGEFEVNPAEAEPAIRSDLMHVRHQIGVLSKVATVFLHPGQPSWASHRVQRCRSP